MNWLGWFGLINPNISNLNLHWLPVTEITEIGLSRTLGAVVEVVYGLFDIGIPEALIHTVLVIYWQCSPPENAGPLLSNDPAREVSWLFTSFILLV